MDPARYLQVTGVAFVNPANPGNYPANVPGNAAAGVRARAEAEHKEQVREYETFQGVTQAIKDIIQEAVDHEYLLEIEDEILGFLNQTPTDMMTHLRNRGGALDFADTKTLLSERDGEWDASEVPQLYFNRVEKAIQGLTRAGINSTLKLRANLMQPSKNGRTDLLDRRRGRILRLSSRQNTQKRINKINLLRRTSRRI